MCYFCYLSNKLLKKLVWRATFDISLHVCNHGYWISSTPTLFSTHWMPALPHLILVSVLCDDALSQLVVEERRTTQGHHLSTNHRMGFGEERAQVRMQTATLREDANAHTHTLAYTCVDNNVTMIIHHE